MRNRVRSCRGFVLLVTLLVSCILLVVVFELVYSLATSGYALRGGVGALEADAAADAALLWAQGLLEEDAAQSSIDHLGEAWATVADPLELNGFRIRIFLYDSLYGPEAGDGTSRARSFRELAERYGLEALEEFFRKEKCNVNTLPRRALEKEFPDLTARPIEEILARRAEKPFEDISQLKSVPDVNDVDFAKLAKKLDVRSNVFLLLAECGRPGKEVRWFVVVLRRPDRQATVIYFCPLEPQQ